MRIITTADAVSDVIETRRWYAKRQEGLDQRFQRELDDALAKIGDRPTSFPVVARGIRRAQLDRFPYLVFYRHTRDEIVIFAVMHGSRSDKAWRDRL
jgi:plasmid stabilization system protein ParE